MSKTFFTNKQPNHYLHFSKKIKKKNHEHGLKFNFLYFFFVNIHKNTGFLYGKPRKDLSKVHFLKKHKKIKKNLKNNFFSHQFFFLVRNFFVRLQKIYFFKIFSEKITQKGGTYILRTPITIAVVFYVSPRHFKSTL